MGGNARNVGIEGGIELLDSYFPIPVLLAGFDGVGSELHWSGCAHA